MNKPECYWRVCATCRRRSLHRNGICTICDINPTVNRARLLRKAAEEIEKDKPKEGGEVQ